MSIWLWISIIVIVIFAVIFIIALLPDDILAKTPAGKALLEAKNCCKRLFQRKARDEYDLGFLRK